MDKFVWYRGRVWRESGGHSDPVSGELVDLESLIEEGSGTSAKREDLRECSELEVDAILYFMRLRAILGR